MPLATPAATATVAATATAAATAASSSAPSPVSTLLAGAPLSAAAMESVKRKGRQLSSEFTQFVTAMARKDSPDVTIPLEFKLLAALVVLFLFLLFLIAVLWDRYGKEIGELYTPSGAAASGAGGDAHDVHPNDVADEYTVYQKLPTFFYEYMPRKKQQ